MTVVSSTKVNSSDLKPLLMLAEEVALQRKILICNEADYRKTESGVEIMPIA